MGLPHIITSSTIGYSIADNVSFENRLKTFGAVTKIRHQQMKFCSIAIPPRRPPVPCARVPFPQQEDPSGATNTGAGLKQFKIQNSEFKMGKVFDSKVFSIWIHAI